MTATKLLTLLLLSLYLISTTLQKVIPKPQKQFCGRTTINGISFFQGNLENTGLYFQFYPTVSNKPVPLLWYIAGDFGTGSVIRALDFAGPLTWNNEAKAFNPQKNTKAYTQNFNLLLIDFPCGAGFGYHGLTCPPGMSSKEIKTLDQMTDIILKGIAEFLKIQNTGQDNCDNSMLMNSDLVMMTDGMGANLVLNAADKFTNQKYVPNFHKNILLVLSDPIIGWKDNFSALDAFLEGRGKYTSMDFQKLLTNQQTQFMLTDQVNNKSLKNLIKNLNQACSKNIYDVTNPTKHVMSSGESWDLFPSIVLQGVDALCATLENELKGVYEKTKNYGTMSYTARTDELLSEMQMNLPDSYAILKRILSKNTTNKKVMVIQSQNDATFNTLGMLRVYSKSNIPDLESLMYSAKTTTLKNHDSGTTMCTVYQTKNDKFAHVQMMGVGYWMAKQKADWVMGVVTSFWKNELMGKKSSWLGGFFG